MATTGDDLNIEVCQIPKLDLPAEMLDFIICQFRFFLERKPLVAQGKTDALWSRLMAALELSRDVESSFFLAPEYTLPFSRATEFSSFVTTQACKNSVYCVPVEHLTLKQVRVLAERMNITDDWLRSCYRADLERLNRRASLVFNVAVIAVKDALGNATFYLQPKILPALLEESKHLPGHLFQGGCAIKVFQTPTFAFAVTICFDFIGSAGRIPDRLLHWLERPGNSLDFLFVLQVNPKPLHREFERRLYLFANHPACQNTSLFFVNCDSASRLQSDQGETISGFNKTSVLGRFRIEATNEYKVEKSLEIAGDKFSGQEILQLDRMQRMMLLDNGERVIWLKCKPLRNWRDGPSYPRENDLRVYNYKHGSFEQLNLSTTFEYSPIREPLPAVPAEVYRPITIRRPSRFLGRSREISEVLEFLKSKKRCLLIYGDPGIGKSALAQQATSVALEREPGRFSGGLWFSSKDRHLSLKNFISDLAVSLDFVYVKQLDESEQKTEILRLLRQTLRGNCILVIDNVDTIRDAEMLEFIREISHHARIILTSRTPLTSGYCLKYLLRPMRRDDYKLLIQSSWPNIDESRINGLLRSLGGSPFALHLLFGYLRAEKLETPGQTITEVVDGERNIVDRMFKDAWDSVGPQGQMVINSLQLFSDAFTEEALRAVTGLPVARIDELFEELKRRYFVETLEYQDVNHVRYQIHPLTRKFSEAKRPKHSTEVRYIAYYTRFVSDHCRTESFQQIEQELRNIEKALDLCIRRNKPANYLKIISQLYYYYYERGFWNDAIEMCVKGYRYAQRTGNRSCSLEMASHVSWCAFRKEDFSLARKWLRISKMELRGSNRVLSRLRGLIEETEARISLVDDQIDVEEAQKLIEDAIRIYESFSDPKAITQQARALSYLGELQLEQRNYERAIEIFTQVKELADKHKNERFARKILAWTLGNLGEALLLKSEPYNARGEYLEICTNLFREGLILARKIERQHTIAHCCWGLGVALLALDRPEATDYLLSAKAIYEKLGKKSRIKALDKLLK